MAQIAVEMTGDPGKLVRALAQAERQQARLEQKLKETAQAGKQVEQAGVGAGNKLKEAGDKGSKAFGEKAAGQLKTYAAGLVSITTVVATLKAGLDAVDASFEAAKQKLIASTGSRGQLAQVGGAGELPGLQQVAKRLYAQGAAGSLSEAYDIAFTAQSTGSMGQLPLYTDLAKYQVVKGSPQAIIDAAAVVKESFGQAETGNERAIVSKALAASEKTRVNLVDLALAAANSGATVEGLRDVSGRGISDEEAMAAAAVLIKTAKTPDIGATRLQSFLAGLGNLGPAYRGRTLRESLAMLKASAMGPDELKTALGGEVAVTGYTTLVNRPELFAATIAAQETAQAEDLVGQRIALNAADPEIRAALAFRQATAQAELAGIPQGIERSLSDATIESIVAARTRAGKSLLMTDFGRKALEAIRYAANALNLGDERIVAEYGNDAEWQQFKEMTGTTYRRDAPFVYQAAGQLSNPIWERVTDLLERVVGNTQPRSTPTLSHPDRDR